jgi:hypothetical protein
MRHKPSPAKRLLIAVGYTVVVFSVWIAVGLTYDEVGDTVDNVRKGITLSMALGAVFVVVAISLFTVWRLHRDLGDVVEPGADQLAAFDTAA